MKRELSEYLARVEDALNDNDELFMAEYISGLEELQRLMAARLELARGDQVQAELDRDRIPKPAPGGAA